MVVSLPSEGPGRLREGATGVPSGLSVEQTEPLRARQLLVRRYLPSLPQGPSAATRPPPPPPPPRWMQKAHARGKPRVATPGLGEGSPRVRGREAGREPQGDRDATRPDRTRPDPRGRE